MLALTAKNKKRTFICQMSVLLIFGYVYTGSCFCIVKQLKIDLYDGATVFYYLSMTETTYTYAMFLLSSLLILLKVGYVLTALTGDKRHFVSNNTSVDVLCVCQLFFFSKRLKTKKNIIWYNNLLWLYHFWL